MPRWPAIGICLMLPAWFSQAHAAGGDAWRLHYTARLHGVPLVAADFCLQMSRAAYQASLSAHTLGLLDLLMHATGQSHASGAIFPDGSIRPHDFADHGRLSGEEYAVAIGYNAGTPVLLREIPPQEKYRLPVPSALLAHGLDGLASTILQSVTAEKGGCADEIAYDGRQVRRMVMHSLGQQQLRPSPRSVFAGQALACDTVSTMLAGYLKSAGQTEQAKPRHGTLWLARLAPGGAYLPVRMRFDADFFGDVIVDLDAVSRSGDCEATVPGG